MPSESPYIDLIDYVAAKLTPRSRQPVDEWVEQNLNIPPKTSGTGPIRFHRHPFARTPLNCWGETPPPIFDSDGNSLADDPAFNSFVHDITLMFCTQSTKTTLINAGMAYRICVHPANTVWVLPNDDLVRSYNHRRFEPFIKANPVLFDKLPRKAREQAILGKEFNDNNFTIAEKHFSGNWIKFAHSGSAAALSETPAEIVIVDEQDKAQRETNEEAASFKLADERTHTYKATCKRFKASTPSDESSPINQDFLKGTQERFYVESPHAPGKFFWLRWKDDEKKYCLSWDRALARNPDGSWNKLIVAATAHYICPFTGKPIYDADKLRMIQSGQWRVTNPNPNLGHRSFHLNCFYSPNHTFGDIALKWIDALEDPTELRNFINSWLAEPFIPHREDEVDLPTGTYEKGFYICRPDKFLKDAPGNFYLRTKPQPGEVDLVTIDKQKYGYYAIVERCQRAGSTAGRPGNSKIIYEGAPESLVSDAALHDLTKSIGVDPTPDNPKRGSRVAIDHGYVGASQVAQLAVQRGWLMLKGDSTQRFYIHTDPKTRAQTRMPWAPPQYINPQEGLGPSKKLRVRLYMWSTPDAYDKLDKLRRGHGSEWLVPSDISEEFQRHMRAWALVTLHAGRKGQEKTEWQNPSRKPDHYWDCCAMMMVLKGLHEIPFRTIQPQYMPQEAG